MNKHTLFHLIFSTVNTVFSVFFSQVENSKHVRVRATDLDRHIDKKGGHPAAFRFKVPSARASLCRDEIEVIYLPVDDHRTWRREGVTFGLRPHRISLTAQNIVERIEAERV